MILLCIPVGIFLLDFFVKRHIDTHKQLDEKQEVCRGKLILTKFYNKGAAFNFLNKYPKLMRGIHGVVIGIALIIYAILFRKKGDTGLKISFGMLLGGGFSNLFDRMTKGHVVDYCSLNVKNKRVRGIVFNISDIFVFLGGILSAIFSSK